MTAVEFCQLHDGMTVGVFPNGQQRDVTGEW